MSSSPLPSHRPPPPNTGRITATGKDQYVLGCSAHLDATEAMFRQLVLYEEDNTALRKELAWLETHSVTRTARYVRSRIFIVAYVVATIVIALGYVLLSTLGRQTRVACVKSWQERADPKIRRIDGSAFLIRDIPQREIDSIVHDINQTTSPFVGR